MKYYFIGIGGIGMSALARFFKQQGHAVSGYDHTESPLTQQLVKEGINVHYDDDPSRIPTDVDKIIITPAVPTTTAVYQTAASMGVPVIKRSQALGELTQGKKCIAVAGSHGKTTTTAMIAHLLMQLEQGCSAFMGGIAKNFNSNLVVHPESEYVVVEADEYDRSFLWLHPFYSIITATDPDHLDIYGDHQHLLQAFTQFADQTEPNGALFIKEGAGFAEHEHDSHSHHHHEGEAEVLHGLSLREGLTVHTYGARSFNPDYYAVNVRNYRGNLFFDLRTPDGVLYDLQLTNSCLYNVENAVVAAAVAISCELTESQLRSGLKSFAGIQRRFDYHINEPSLTYIDDYAHHPQEIAATIESVRYLYPGKRIVGVFQPHLYSRTAEFYKEFADVLSTLDEVVLMDIYPAREEPIPGVTSRLIMREMKKMNRYLIAREEVCNVVVALCPDIVLTMGAGDIDRLVPQMERTLRENM
ncbi:MAG: UDP-N-acetylmuramate--L-alanine ligase [Bacteroidales bacterium]|nr:UDP-N-acetylmuramate--L-alanine ligase [Bacteroidales bacterium]